MNEETTEAGTTEQVGAAGEEISGAGGATVAVAPNSVAGQRHVSPPARHSQQAHARATARAQALGLTTARELHDHDRAEVLAKLQKSTDGKLAQQRNEQSRRSGAGTDKA